MGLNYFSIFERMLKAGGLRNGTEMAKALGITPQAISNYRKKQEMPPGIIIKFANTYNVSIDWLISGKGYAFLSDIGDEANPTTLSPGAEAPKIPNTLGVMILTPDEMICVGKLLIALRRGSKNTGVEIKTSIDAFLNAPPTGAPSP